MKKITVLAALLLLGNLLCVYSQTQNNTWSMNDLPDWIVSALDMNHTESFLLTNLQYIPFEVMELLNLAKAKYPILEAYFVWRQLDSRTVQMYVFFTKSQEYWLKLVYAY